MNASWKFSLLAYGPVIIVFLLPAAVSTTLPGQVFVAPWLVFILNMLAKPGTSASLAPDASGGRREEQERACT